MSRGRRSSAAPPCPSVILDVRRAGDMWMSGGRIQRRPSTIGDVTTVGPRHVRVPHCGPMSISLPRCHNLASGRRTPPRRGRCTPVSPALDVTASPGVREAHGVRHRRPVRGLGRDTGVRPSAAGAGAGLGPAPGSAGRRAPVVPAAAAPDQGCPGSDAPGGQGGGGQGYPTAPNRTLTWTQQRGRPDGTGWSARSWLGAGWVGQQES
jgi:hypothetical protein